MIARPPGDAELERQVRDLRRRLLALAQVLPAEYLPLLELGPDEIALAVVPARMWEGWDESSKPKASDVESELLRLWRRLTPT